jgi:hypothetical protein
MIRESSIRSALLADGLEKVTVICRMEIFAGTASKFGGDYN